MSQPERTIDGVQEAVQETLLEVKAAVRARAPRPAPQPAPARPIARVVVDTPLPHLDHPFDYRVPLELDERARPGARVRVRFAGRQLGGFLLERLPESDHEGTLSWLAGVVSDEPVLTPEVHALCAAVAARYAGTLPDVLRLAIPPRHARVEAEPRGVVEADGMPGAAARWEGYEGGPELLAGLAAGRSPRHVWSALPGPGWPHEIAAAVVATLTGGRGSVVVVPDARDLVRVDAALTAALGAGRHVALHAELGPAERYRRFLRVLRGEVQVVAGTRAAAFAPVRDLGLVVCWDDGDDLLAEPRAPYPHAREVLALRSHLTGGALLVGGHAPGVDAWALLTGGWATPMRPARSALRAARARVVVAEPGPARLPHRAFVITRAALDRGRPVLVQVSRAGYQPGLACAACRAQARCTSCHGPVGRRGRDATPACGWCGRPSAAWRCPSCGGAELVPRTAGQERTAEELGQAFPGVAVRHSGGERVLAEVPAGPALVVATPGAEPVAPGAGYGAALLLDGSALLARPDLRAGEEALRRWSGAVGLVAPDGEVLLVAPDDVAPVQALVRADPLGHAEREAGERAALGFPPAVRIAAIDGAPDALAAFLARADLPPGHEVLGPVPRPERRSGRERQGVEGEERVLVRVPRREGAALAAALRAALALRSAQRGRRDDDVLRVQLDPADLA